jgi:flagellar motor switch protein FliN/FliY
MSDSTTARAFADRLVADFGGAIESVLGRKIEVASSAGGEGAGWIVRITLSGTLLGTIAVWISEADAAVLAQRVMGMDDLPDQPTIVDMLGEMWTQAASAVGVKEPFTGVKSALSTAEAGNPDPEGIAAYQLRIAEDASVRLLIAGAVTMPVVALATKPAPARPAPELASEPNARLEVVLDIDLPLVVRFGRTSMSLKALADLGPGSIVDMGRSPDEPVEMLIGERVVARGEVVVVGGNYGVRIMDLINSAERTRVVER